MHVSRAATAALAATASTVAAFTVNRSSRCTFASLGASNAWTRSVNSVLPSSSVSRNQATRGGLNMFFAKFFGGGAFASKIDYETLDHPGPELAKAASQGKVVVHSEKDPNLAAATFAGGCFWGLELAYQRVPGVVYTATGYSQGPEESPTYDTVCAGATGHTEAVMVYYDPKECSYEDLLDTYFNRVDPMTRNGQGMDFGKQYRTGVYYHTPEQEKLATERFAKEQEKYDRPMASELKAAMSFWPAEKYHQQYLEKGGRFGQPQNAEKGATEEIRCYG